MQRTKPHRNESYRVQSCVLPVRPILAAVLLIGMMAGAVHTAEPVQGDARLIDLGDEVTLELVYIPPGEFKMGSTPEEKAWATGIEGGARPGTARA